MLRALVLLLVLGGLSWWLWGEQSRGRFRQVDAAFLEVLLANTRDRFVPDAAKADQVVFVPLQQSDASEFAAWPPQPVDYQMVLKGALHFKPSVIVLVDPMHWPEPKPPMVASLAEVMLPLPAVVVTACASSGSDSADEAAAALLAGRLGRLVLQRGDSASLPVFASAFTVPELPLLRATDPALLPTPPQQDGAVPVLCVRGGNIHPSPGLLGALRALQIPLSSVSVALGGGAGVLSDGGFYLPVEENGTILPSVPLVTQNALDLMTVTMVDDAAEDISRSMGTNRVLVIGMDGPEHGAARQQAEALAHALALPRVQMLTGLVYYVPWLVAVLLGLSLLSLPRDKGLSRSLIYLLFGIVACYLLFVLRTLWFSPVVPACLLIASGLFVRWFGKRKLEAPNG